MLGVRGCDKYVTWKYTLRLEQATSFKRELDQRFPTGARQADVDAYLQSRTIEVIKTLTAEGRDEPLYSGKYFIVVSRGKSLAWYCGSDLVGVEAEFSSDGHLKRSEVLAWSSDCP